MLVVLLALSAHAVDLTTSGACPGPVVIDAAGLTPLGDFVLLRSRGVGAARIPGGPCADTVSGLAAPLSWHGPFPVDGLGRGGLAPDVPPSADGSYLQALDLRTCTLSPAVSLCDDGAVYEEFFTEGVTPTWQCDSWVAFKSAIADGYSAVTLSGSADIIGLACTEPGAADSIVAAIRDHHEVEVDCDGHLWTYCSDFGSGEGELFIDARYACDPSNCPSPGYVLRPCQDNESWGGAGTNTCGGPSQSLRLELTR
ncbi:MAG: hypothetical protein ACI8PZ_006726 [Myxococcota bacterium]|jgi:hypothetical protein